MHNVYLCISLYYVHMYVYLPKYPYIHACVSMYVYMYTHVSGCESYMLEEELHLTVCLAVSVTH